MASERRRGEDLKDERANSLLYSRSETAWMIYPRYLIGDIPEALFERSRINQFSAVDRRTPLPPGTERLAVWGSGSPPRNVIFPMAHPNLPFELAKIEFGDSQAVLEFVHRWGTLGFDRLIDLNMVASFDPLWFVWWHARTIKDVLDIYTALQSGDVDAITAAVTAAAQPEESSIDVGVMDAMGYHVSGRHVGSTASDFTLPVEEQGLGLIRSFVSGNIAEIHPSVGLQNSDVFPYETSPSPLKRLNVTFTFTALIQAIWWHLADFVHADGEVGRCQECGKHFPRTHKRQRFCPPSEEHRLEVGAVRQRAQSLCGLRNRTRRHRS